MKAVIVWRVIFGLFLVWLFANWWAMPTTLASVSSAEASGRASLLSTGKSRLQIVTLQGATEKFGCGEAPFVCQYVETHPDIELSVVLARPELMQVKWLVSARAGDRILLAAAASENRLHTEKFMAAWSIFLVAVLLAASWAWPRVFSRAHVA